MANGFYSIWCHAWTLASDATEVFAFDDDYAMGILSSSTHEAWAKSRSSTLEDRLRYTPSTVFAGFPWPYPVGTEQREKIGTISANITKRRQGICAASAIGLTTLYNQVDEGAYADLKALHRKLDEAVAEAYGWPNVAAHDSDVIVRQLLELNREISAGKRNTTPSALRRQQWTSSPCRTYLLIARQLRRSRAARPAICSGSPTPASCDWPRLERVDLSHGPRPYQGRA